MWRQGFNVASTSGVCYKTCLCCCHAKCESTRTRSLWNLYVVLPRLLINAHTCTLNTSANPISHNYTNGYLVASTVHAGTWLTHRDLSMATWSSCGCRHRTLTRWHLWSASVLPEHLCLRLPVYSCRHIVWCRLPISRGGLTMSGEMSTLCMLHMSQVHACCKQGDSYHVKSLLKTRHYSYSTFTCRLQ